MKVKGTVFLLHATFCSHDNNKFVSLLLKGVILSVNIWIIGKNSMKCYYLKKIITVN